MSLQNSANSKDTLLKEIRQNVLHVRQIGFRQIVFRQIVFRQIVFRQIVSNPHAFAVVLARFLLSSNFEHSDSNLFRLLENSNLVHSKLKLELMRSNL